MAFASGSWKVNKGSMVVAYETKTRTLYITSNCRNTLVVVDASVNSNLWHCRLGHINEKGMKVLFSKGKVLELKTVEHSLYETFIFGKHKKVSFSKLGR